MDPDVPGVTADELRQALRWVGDADGTLHVLWYRIARRVTLAYIYDAVHSLGLAALPSKAEALAAWDDLRRGDDPGVGGALTVGGARDVALPHAAKPLTLGPAGFDVVLNQSADSVYINHAWVICVGLRFPREAFETLHANIATELYERVARLAHPHCFVQSYRHGDQVLPLLLWYRVSEREVTYLLQEFLHLRYRHIPEARMWHWQLLPSHANVNLVGAAFARSGLFPAWSDLVRYAGHGSARPPAIDRANLLAHAGHVEGDGAMHAEYDRGRIAFWIGDEVFFAVECPPDDRVGETLANLRLPEGPRDLPPWGARLLQSVFPEMDEFTAATNIQRFLSWFGETHNGRAVRLLRSVHWPMLPLVWRPLFLTGIPVRTTENESADAQIRLVKSVAAVWEDAETVAEAIELLHGITGVSTR